MHSKKIKLIGLVLVFSVGLKSNAIAQVLKVIGSSHESTLTYTGDIADEEQVFGWYDISTDVNNKHVTITGSNYGAFIGAFSTKNVDNNTVIINGNSSKSIIGGYAAVGSANYNSLLINGNVSGIIIGATAANSIAGHNTVTIGGNSSGSVIGAQSNNGIAYNNIVTIGGNTTELYMAGTDMPVSYTVGGVGSIAINNTVTIAGDSGRLTIGGWARGITHGNKVTLGGDIKGIVIGGLSDEKSSTNNIVTLVGDKKIGTANTEIYGGATGAPYDFSANSSLGDLFIGNTLNFAAGSLVANKIINFEYYNFILNTTLVNTDTALITTESIVFGNPDKSNSSKINVTGIKQGEKLHVGDKFFLIKSEGMSGIAEGQVFYAIAQQGISVLYDVETTVDIDKGEAIAIILRSKDTEPGTGEKEKAGRVNPQLKALSEGHLADLMLLTRGADMVAYSTFDTIKEVNDGGFVPFMKMGGSHNRYDSGSRIKSNDYFIMAGVSLRNHNLTTAAFIEAGWGNYDTRNTFSDAAKVDGDGDNRYVGIGVLGKYEFSNGMYADGSLRFGKSYNKFNTSDIKNLTTGETARYSFNRNYVSAHAGVGYIHNIDAKNELDFSAKYLWTHLGSKDAMIAGDNIKFDSLDSNRLRLTATWNHQYTESTKFKAGIGYEYEFSAKAKATALNTYSIDVPSVKGSTGIVTLGMNINPESNKRLGIDFNINGYAGKRDGVSANIKVDYHF